MYKHIGTRPELLLKEYPEAYAALEEPYKADGCLYFYVDVGEDNTLYADYDMGGCWKWNGKNWIAEMDTMPPSDNFPTDIQGIRDDIC